MEFQGLYGVGEVLGSRNIVVEWILTVDHEHRGLFSAQKDHVRSVLHA